MNDVLATWWPFALGLYIGGVVVMFAVLTSSAPMMRVQGMTPLRPVTVAVVSLLWPVWLVVAASPSKGGAR